MPSQETAAISNNSKHSELKPVEEVPMSSAYVDLESCAQADHAATAAHPGLIALMLGVTVSLVLFRAGAHDRSPAAVTVFCESTFKEV